MTERQRAISAFMPAVIFLAGVWIMFAIFKASYTDMVCLGIRPLRACGLIGIITSPLAHADISHLASNSTVLAVLMVALFYFYRDAAYCVFLLNWLLSGTLLWIFGRHSVHIGASGIAYGLAFFIVFGGLLRKRRELKVVSLVVVFMYGGMVWGMMPQGGNISWDGHLLGALSGLVLAIAFRKPRVISPVTDSSPFSVSCGSPEQYQYFYQDSDPSDRPL